MREDLAAAGASPASGHHCDAPVSVTVDGVGIPVIDEGVTLYERKDGPCSITRRADITFPIKSEEATWTDHIDAFSESGGMQQATVRFTGIDIEGNQNDYERTKLIGYVSSVGSRRGANVGRLVVLGPYKFLNSIPASFTVQVNDPYIGGATKYRELLNYIVERYNQEIDVFPDIELGDIDEVADEDIVKEYTNSSISQTHFTASRDTLADVVEVVSGRNDVRIWFEPHDDGTITLEAQRDPGSDYDATEGGDIPVIYNDALYEMRPFNSLRLRGAEGIDIDYEFDITPFPVVTATAEGQYPEAEAWYPPLVDRAGKKLFRVENSSRSKEPKVRTEAKSRLKEMLDEVSGGTMDTALSPELRPYDRLTAKPACASIIDADVPELTYEVERTAHTLAPDDNDRDPQVPSTEVSLSMSIDPSKIKVDSETLSSQPSEAGDNKPPDDSPDSEFSWDFL